MLYLKYDKNKNQFMNYTDNLCCVWQYINIIITLHIHWIAVGSQQFKMNYLCVRTQLRYFVVREKWNSR